MAEPQLKRRLSIPRDLSSDDRVKLAELVINFIQDRTNKGKDINNKPFQTYSQDYIESRDFKTAGKSRRVNLSQTGDTIASIELLSHGSGYITIGYDAGSHENDKAVWLQRSDNGASRKFLGIDDVSLSKFVKQIQRENPTTKDNERSIRDARNTTVANILKLFGL